MDKKELKRAEVEIIVFEKNDDIVTTSITVSGESASGFEW